MIKQHKIERGLTVDRAIKLIQVYVDFDGTIKADFVEKGSGVAFTTNEAQLKARIEERKVKGLQVVVEEIALNFIQRWPYYAATFTESKED